MLFTRKELDNFVDNGKDIGVHSVELIKLLSKYRPSEFNGFLSRSYYYWKSGTRPVPLRAVLKIMDGLKVKSVDIQKFSVGGGNVLSVPMDDLIEFHYLLGLILGDGCLVVNEKKGNRRTYLMQITFRLKSEAIFIRKHCISLFNINPSIYRGEGCWNLCLYSKPLVFILNTKYNVPLGLKYAKICVPERVKMGSKNEKIAFLKGVFDSDGNIYKYKSRVGVQLRQRSQPFIIELWKLFSQVGIDFNHPYFDKANHSWLLWSSKKELVDSFINRINTFNINAPVAQPG